jgi:wobble nucleotide-excising tRNase
MLKRIHKIKNIGRFVDCNAGGCEFSSETIIFGLNTQGKSTLTAILRSIQTGNNDLLIGRKTFGVSGGKKVEIDFEDNGINEKYIFENKTWNKFNSNIIIYDSKFITENVFDGENITFNQQKNLNAVIIGKDGHELNNEIIALQERSEELAQEKTKKTMEFSRYFTGIELENFIKLKPDDMADEKIIAKEKEIRFEKAKEEIKKIIEYYIKNISDINFSIKNILQKTLDLKQEEIENHIKAHFGHKEGSRIFLNNGLFFLKERPDPDDKRVCVFCGQELGDKAEKLIEIYAKFFKGGYEQLQGEINLTAEYFKRLSIETMLTKMVSDLKLRDIDIELDDIKIKEIAESKNNFEKELELKKDLNYKIDFTNFDYLEKEIIIIKHKLEKFELEKISNRSSKNPLLLEEEKHLLEIVKKRFDPLWIKFCKEIADIEIEAKPLRELRDKKRKELELYSTSIFETHKKTINLFCQEMGADFIIEDFKPLKKIIGQSERIFAIKFFGNHKINISNSDEKTPNFKNTLSESDKRLLSFAFFLSLMAHDKELNKKIIIFDDPMSSFDSERRRKTVQLIADIKSDVELGSGKKQTLFPKQKIVLTHDDRFAKELARLMSNAKTLKIKDCATSEQKQSEICWTDFSHDFPDDEIIDKIKKIKNIFEMRQFNIPFETDCRIVLENIFKRKYQFHLKDQLPDRRKSVRSFVVKLNELQISGFHESTKFQKFTRLCDDLCIELHDNGSVISNGDKQSILKDFFECIEII